MKTREEIELAAQSLINKLGAHPDLYWLTEFAWQQVQQAVGDAIEVNATQHARMKSMENDLEQLAAKDERIAELEKELGGWVGGAGEDGLKLIEKDERIAALEKENQHLEDGLTLAGGEINLCMEKYVKAEERINDLQEQIADLRRRLREAEKTIAEASARAGVGMNDG